jgi:hypothetical protein
MSDVSPSSTRVITAERIVKSAAAAAGPGLGVVLFQLLPLAG